MTRATFVLMTSLTSVCAGAAQEVENLRKVAEAPELICPVLPGMQIPQVTVQDLEGNPVPLGRLTAAQPTILLFYRGGW